MTSSGLRTAGRLFGIDLAGLFKDDEDGKGFLGLNPMLSFSTTSKCRGGALSFRPQQQTGVTSTLGFGAGGGINNINVVGSNFGQGNTLQEPATEETTETPKEPETPAAQPFFETQNVQFSRTPMDYTKNLSKQEAVGKANQLLHRTLGDKIKDQETYNRLFDPLLKDLQTGDDYGFDIDRLYKNIRKEGFEPYKDVTTKFGGQPFGGKGAEGGADAYSSFVNQMFAADKPFFDQADAGRRFLEAKAFYRPGAENTKLDRIGQIQNRFDQYEMGFKGQGGEAYGDTGYRTGNVYGNLRPFYEKYLEGMNFTNPRADAPDFKQQTPSTTKSESKEKKISPQATTDYKQFADYDFASQGGKGFGMKDVEYLTGQGATTGQLRALRDAARMQGLNVGDRAMQLLQQGSQQTEGKFDDYDFASEGGKGFGYADINALLGQGATRKDISAIGKRAKEQGLQIGDRARGLFAGLR